MAVGTALGADTTLLADVLPAVEDTIITALVEPGDDPCPEEES